MAALHKNKTLEMNENRNHTTIQPLSHKKIAIVHDFLVAYGGAERVLQALVTMYPEAPIYTLLKDEALVERYFPGREVRTSFLQRLPQWIRRRYTWLLPFYPVAIETLDLRDFELILSSSGAWSKGVITRLHTQHIAYLHSPMRYAWEQPEAYLDEVLPRWVPRIIARLWLSYMRLWDRQAAERPDILLANSYYTQSRIAKYYRKEATVVYPPAFDLCQLENQEIVSPPERQHFLVVSRLTRSNKIRPVIEAFNKLGFPLVIVGTGREAAWLERRAEKNIVFVGAVDDTELCRYYRGARALLFPSEEDFGMVAVEALSCGTPVIAYDFGGIREIIRVGETGEIFQSQTPEVIAEAVKRFVEKESTTGYPESLLKASVERFSQSAFQAGIHEAMEKVEH